MTSLASQPAASAQSLVERALSLAPWKGETIHAFGDGRCLLINATVAEFGFDTHDEPETLIALQGRYAIEMPEGVVHIEQGSTFTVPPGVAHRPANTELCVILVLR